MNKWIAAIRPRTLPLAIAGVILGGTTAYHTGFFRWEVGILTLLTAIALQILSNLANDLGDFEKGTDSKGGRSDRALSSGSISLVAMKNAVVFSAAISLMLGIVLLWVALGPLSTAFWVFMGMGLLSIAAAILYTVGNGAYGYRGLGDLSVLVFFGIIAVSGSYYLHHQSIPDLVTNSLKPGFALGFLCVGVLNINNIRDINSDRMNGKNTIAVMLGRNGAIVYQTILILLSAILMILQWFGTWNVAHFLFLIPFPLFLFHTYKLKRTNENDVAAHHRLLKNFVMLTLLFVVLYSISTTIL